MDNTISKIERNLNNFLESVAIKTVSNGVITIVRKRTLKGKYLEGSSAGAGEYSTKPFAMPLGALTGSGYQTSLTNRMHATIIGKGSFLKNSDFQLFTSKTNTLWVLVKGGYKEIRSLAKKQVQTANLNWSGRMMRNLGIQNLTAKTSVLGFNDAESNKLAYYHNIMGVGKSKKKRVFMGLTDTEVNELVQDVNIALKRHLTTV